MVQESVNLRKRAVNVGGSFELGGDPNPPQICATNS